MWSRAGGNVRELEIVSFEEHSSREEKAMGDVTVVFSNLRACREKEGSDFARLLEQNWNQ